METIVACALEDVEEKRNDAHTSAMRKLTVAPTSQLAPQMMMMQCEQTMLQSAKQRKFRTARRVHTNRHNNRDGFTIIRRSRAT